MRYTCGNLSVSLTKVFKTGAHFLQHVQSIVLSNIYGRRGTEYIPLVRLRLLMRITYYGEVDIIFI